MPLRITLSWCRSPALLLAAAACGLGAGQPEKNLRHESFDKDPQWDGHNNRIGENNPVTVRQDFGYDQDSPFHGPGIGGLVTTAAAPAYYAKKLPPRTLSDSLSASGKIIVPKGGVNALIGFFNDSTLNEWRTPNTIALRIAGRGDSFYAYVEYCTARWRAGGIFPSEKPGAQRLQFPSGDTPHQWELRYDPTTRTISATMDDQALSGKVRADHVADGLTVNHFGIFNCLKSDNNHRGSVWISDVKIDGQAQRLDHDPEWHARNNRRTYEGHDVRPRFNFGYSPTHFAAGAASGEMGGIVFRGDERFPERMAYYGDRLEDLTLDQPLEASGRVALLRGVTDSAVMLGFFHSKDSIRPGTAQKQGSPYDFLGVVIEGPSREGFYFYPSYATDVEGEKGSAKGDLPRIYPDGNSHTWSLKYDPAGAEGHGSITVKFDQKTCSLNPKPEARKTGAHFDRFGIVTTRVDGNEETIYFDDLTYTARK